MSVLYIQKSWDPHPHPNAAVGDVPCTATRKQWQRVNAHGREPTEVKPQILQVFVVSVC